MALDIKIIKKLKEKRKGKEIYPYVGINLFKTSKIIKQIYHQKKFKKRYKLV